MLQQIHNRVINSIVGCWCEKDIKSRPTVFGKKKKKKKKIFWAENTWLSVLLASQFYNKSLCCRSKKRRGNSGLPKLFTGNRHLQFYLAVYETQLSLQHKSNTVSRSFCGLIIHTSISHNTGNRLIRWHHAHKERKSHVSGICMTSEDYSANRPDGSPVGIERRQELQVSVWCRRSSRRWPVQLKTVRNSRRSQWHAPLLIWNVGIQREGIHLAGWMCVPACSS